MLCLDPKIVGADPDSQICWDSVVDRNYLFRIRIRLLREFRITILFRFLHEDAGVEFTVG